MLYILSTHTDRKRDVETVLNQVQHNISDTEFVHVFDLVKYYTEELGGFPQRSIADTSLQSLVREFIAIAAKKFGAQHTFICEITSLFIPGEKDHEYFPGFSYFSPGVDHKDNLRLSRLSNDKRLQNVEDPVASSHVMVDQYLCSKGLAQSDAAVTSASGFETVVNGRSITFSTSTSIGVTACNGLVGEPSDLFLGSCFLPEDSSCYGDVCTEDRIGSVPGLITLQQVIPVMGMYMMMQSQSGGIS